MLIYTFETSTAALLNNRRSSEASNASSEAPSVSSESSNASFEAPDVSFETVTCLSKKKNMNIKTLGNKIKGNPSVAGGTVFSILIIIGIGHFLNDMIQSVVPSIYPILKDKFGFSFAQIGIITFVFQISSSILQPLTGLYADRHPRPYSLSVGMCFTLVGLLLLAVASSYALILLSVAVIGIGSSVFHPVMHAV